MKALLLIDVQYDFMPPIKVMNGEYPGTGKLGFGFSTIGGALAVPKGDEIVPVIEKLMENPEYQIIIATQDWHPEDHCSFFENGGIWPKHCVQNSVGARIHSGVYRKGLIIVQKGVNQDVDSYSGFWDNERKHETPLKSFLKGVDEVHICGLATEYCVLFTALDSVEAGYKTTVLLEACRGVDINLGDCDKAVQRMRDKGIIIA